MPRLAILSSQEVRAFDKPPRFTLEQRKKYFQKNEKLFLRTVTTTRNTQFK